jgi:hypothetical protein
MTPFLLGLGELRFFFKGVDEDAKNIKDRDKGKTSKDDIQRQRAFKRGTRWK